MSVPYPFFSLTKWTKSSYGFASQSYDDFSFGASLSKISERFRDLTQ
jgi:hypothetical protein